MTKTVHIETGFLNLRVIDSLNLILFSFSLVLRTKPELLCMLGKHSTTEL